MSDDRTVVLTNDDGIDCHGLRTVYEALSERWDVTAVAPADDYSGIGRALTETFSVDSHELGYVVDGTPSTCAVVADTLLDADLVVSGCNTSPNITEHMLGRSGTVGAAVEAALAGIPSIAVSLYGTKESLPRDPEPEAYDRVRPVVRYLADRILRHDLLRAGEYLNVNVPVASEQPGEIRLTAPATEYELRTTRRSSEMAIEYRFWDNVENAEDIDAPDSDRRTLADGDVSVSPLRAVQSPCDLDRFRSLEGDPFIDATPAADSKRDASRSLR